MHKILALVSKLKEEMPVMHSYTHTHTHTQLTSVHKVILLHPHLPSTDYIGDDVLEGSVLVDAISPLINGDHIPVLLVHGPLPSLPPKKLMNK